jgi:hypothetical protein
MSAKLRNVLIGAALLAGSAQASAQEAAEPAPSVPAPTAEAKAPPADPFAAIPAAKPEDVRSIDAIVTALYDVISGDAGVKRDWDRFRSLFYPGARMIPTRVDARTKGGVALIATPEIYIQNNREFLEGQGFHEQELFRRVNQFGSMAQILSVYQAKTKLSDEKPLVRGINSLQLINDGKRWWVMTIAWHPETADTPIPAEYLKKVER